MSLRDIFPRLEARRRRGGRDQRAFTLIELLVVISIIAILAALVMGAARHANQAKTIKRVQAELQNLTAAINAYHVTYNQFPPDNTNSPYTNQLFYELVGTTYVTNSTYPDGGYITPGGQEGISLGMVTNTFSVPGFLNTSSATDVNDRESPRSKQFLSFQPKDHTFLFDTNSPQILAVPALGPVSLMKTNQLGDLLNFWGYTSSNPTNNPKSYDLWAQVMLGGSTNNNYTNTICNWSADVIVK